MFLLYALSNAVVGIGDGNKAHDLQLCGRAAGPYFIHIVLAIGIAQDLLAHLQCVRYRLIGELEEVMTGIEHIELVHARGELCKTVTVGTDGAVFGMRRIAYRAADQAW